MSVQDRDLSQLEAQYRRYFHLDGEVQKAIDEVEDGQWQGRKVSAWNHWIFPHGVADEQTLSSLRKTYALYFQIYQEINDKLQKLRSYYLEQKDCEGGQKRTGSLIYYLEDSARRRLIQFCTIARTGKPCDAWANRHEIKCLDLPSAQTV